MSFSQVMGLPIPSMLHCIIEHFYCYFCLQYLVPFAFLAVPILILTFDNSSIIDFQELHSLHVKPRKIMLNLDVTCWILHVFPCFQYVTCDRVV